VEGRAQLVDVPARLAVEAQLDGAADRVVLVDDGHLVHCLAHFRLLSVVATSVRTVLARGLRRYAPAGSGREDALAHGIGFRLLGPVDVTVDGRAVEIGSAKQRALLESGRPACC
jgi:hypothetical protein